MGHLRWYGSVSSALVSRSRAMPAGGQRSKPSTRFFTVGEGSFAAFGRDAGLNPTSPKRDVACLQVIDNTAVGKPGASRLALRLCVWVRFLAGAPAVMVGARRPPPARSAPPAPEGGHPADSRSAVRSSPRIVVVIRTHGLSRVRIPSHDRGMPRAFSRVRIRCTA